MNTPGYVAAVLANAQAGGIHGAELAALRSRLRQLADPQAGLLPGEVLQPVTDLPRLDELPEPPPGQARDLLDQLAVIKLNGGLGTSMGLSGPKSLLPVKPGMNFLDIIARQVLALRERHRARLPLVLMNSAATRGPSLEVLGGYRGLREPVPLENSQQVLVAFGGHETCPRPVLGGLAWRVRWPRRRWRARVCCPAAVPRRGVLSLRVYRAVVLVSGPGSPRTGVHGRD